ncbi:protein DMP3 [Rutidosis leptorrhynchoides]|uniref:protein DMP3 n=1 Tax=Rutidosis leptorrhynchoides TaxID=125765 RepID=UPI003A995B9D
MSLRATQPTTTASDDTSTTEPPTTRPQPLPSALSQTLTNTANLAKLLPTGTLLVFQILTPIFTNNGSCDSTTRSLTAILLVLLAVSCFLACFTDSFKTDDGQLYYGFATFHGMWLFDYYDSKNVPDLRKYRLMFIDWVHAVLSVLIFGAIALRDKNVVNCFYPSPGHETEEVLDIVPIGVGLISSGLFVLFPTRRHGIGYPVTHDNTDTD